MGFLNNNSKILELQPGHLPTRDEGRLRPPKRPKSHHKFKVNSWQSVG